MSDADAMAVICTLSPSEQKLMLSPVDSSCGELRLVIGDLIAWRVSDQLDRLNDLGLIDRGCLLTPDGIRVRTTLFSDRSNRNGTD